MQAPDNTAPRGFIAAFAGHRIAPNLLMIMMIVGGLFVANRFETRFFPEFNTQTIVVNAAWAGASAEDVAASLLMPMENELRNIPDLKKMTSVANDNLGLIYLEFLDGVDSDKASDDVQRYLDLAAPNLPADSDAPETAIGEIPDEILWLTLSGDRLADLRALARRLEAELLQQNVRVDVKGLPKDVIEIRLSQRRLAELNMSPADVGAQIARQNVDTTAGSVDGRGNSRLLRTLSKGKSIAHFAEMPVLDGGGDYVPLADIAEIVRLPAAGEETIFFNGRPAVQFQITRADDGNTLKDARAVLAWLDKKRLELPPNVSLDAHKQEWQIVDSRLNLLLKNGAQGLLLVLMLLFLMLNWHLAVWIAASIPAVFMVALCALFFLGGTMDVLTMFAFIMVTGIVVDDSIVVGENALYHRQSGKPPLQAAVDGSREMFPAVLSSTFTTLASFMPLMIIGGPIGSILFVIPLVVFCVLFSALFECFTVLPGHMKSAFRHIAPRQKEGAPRRATLDSVFERFQEGAFRRFVVKALRYRWVTIASAFAALVLSVALFIGGFVKYRFFPGADLDRVYVQVSFIAGTSKERVHDFMFALADIIGETAAEFPEGEDLIRHTTLYLGSGLSLDGVVRPKGGDEHATMLIELTEGENRATSADELIDAWRARAPVVAGVENLAIIKESGGPPGEDLQIRLIGGDLNTLKAAALELRAALGDIPGVARPTDDMPYGKVQVVFELTSAGRALNLSVDDVARQLRAAFDGFDVQTLYEGVDEIEVRTLLAGGDSAEDFAFFRVRLPGGGTAALTDVVRLKSRPGFDTLLRVNAEPVVHVSGEVDFDVTDEHTAFAQAEALLPAILAKHGVSYEVAGARADENQTVADMQTGLKIAFFSIFIILAAAFASWTLPLIIILTAPLGVIGAILGHWIMGYEMSILSIFGIFALNGIVINDSIVLVRDYLARQGAGAADAGDKLIADSVCRRLRAILLTSLTTIGGLTPLMFETSTQAQFLIPMAISVCFGLGFATLLILFVMPAYLSVHNSIGRVKDRLFARADAGAAAG